MRHEKIIKRYKGDIFRIIAEIITAEPFYKITVLRQFRGGKSWYPLPDLLENSTYKSLSCDEKREHDMGIALKFVTADEIKELIEDLHEKLKPDYKLLNIEK